MSQASKAWDRIQFARNYTIRLLDSIPVEDWHRVPSAGVSHVAWQAGHLAMAQFRLCLDRIRGHRADDERIIPATFVALYGRGGIPDPEKSHSRDDLLTVLEAVHRAVGEEISTMPDEALAEPTSTPHPHFHTKLGALEWSANHELIHAGQIGLLRQFRQDPMW
ncbi:MAG: DinB family protein [Planctomycetota bacterium]